MQKKLIALAIAGLASSAFAQSNVTIYGAADASFDFIRVSGGAANADTPNFQKVSTPGSHLGFKGVESLGNGMAAVFQFESDVNFDGQGTFGATRDSYVALAGSFGTVALGNLTGPTRAFGEAMDVNTNHDGITSNRAVLGKMGGLLQGQSIDANSELTVVGSNVLSGLPGLPGQSRSSIGSSIFDTRLKNAIAYISPNFSGFQATLGYFATENKSDSALSKIKTSAYDLGLTYSNGPIWAGLTYGDIQVRNNPGYAGTEGGTLSSVGATDLRTKETRLGGKYDFGNATVRLMWSRNQTDAGGGFDIEQDVWGIGGTFNVTANGKITAQYYDAQDVDGNAGTLVALIPVGSNTGAKFFSLGYEHSLSKRTMLKAAYARLDNDSNALGYDFAHSTGLAGSDIELSGFQVGLRHSF
jgi:predicted porin